MQQGIIKAEHVQPEENLIAITLCSPRAILAYHTDTDLAMLFTQSKEYKNLLKCLLFLTMQTKSEKNTYF